MIRRRPELKKRERRPRRPSAQWLATGPHRWRDAESAAPHITIRLIATVQQMTQFTARPQQIGQAGNQIRNLGRASERDMAPVKVDGPGRVPVNLQDTGSALQGETLQDSSDLRTRWRI
jgi:hypothetical protein